MQGYQLAVAKGPSPKNKKVFDRQDFDYIRKEMKATPDQTEEDYLPSSNKQVVNFRILHHTIGEMNTAGLPYLHSLFNGLVGGAFPPKKYYDAYYFRTPIPKRRKERRLRINRGKDVNFTRT